MITIYGRTNPPCHYCVLAKNMLEKSDLNYEFLDLSAGEWSIPQISAELGIELKTVPVVVCDGDYIGGASDLHSFIKKLNR